MTSLLNCLHFRGFNLTPYSQSSKNLTCILNVFLKGVTKYDVIQIWYTNSVPQVSQIVFHKTLKCSRCLGKAKWYPNPFVKAPWSDKSCQSCLDSESLMIGLPLIKDRKLGVPTEVVQHFLYSGYWVMGFLNYYSGYVKNFSRIAKPIYDLVKMASQPPQEGQQDRMKKGCSSNG